ncbi:MAG: winged helix-turn-helix transcriptional regulator [Pelistega sp.]|nr:winged helix-turn-helix transcriptional regulator [Pelistega sp.]
MNTVEHAKHPYACPVNTTLELIGGKWKVVILYQLTIKTQRFNELRRLIPDVTQRMLTLQLREMEHDGLIHREVYPVVPPKVEYSLSEFGRTLLPVVQSMHDWGVSYEQECQRILANRKA